MIGLGKRDFKDWIDGFNAEVCVMLKVYADESGTHHPRGEQRGAEVPVIGGFIASPSEWRRFERDWSAVLGRHNVTYFHAKEFEGRNFGTPYYGWSEGKAMRFKYALAEVAGRNTALGGAYHLKEHYKQKPNDTKYPYRGVISMFFQDLLHMLNEHGKTNEKIHITFDSGTGKKWNDAIADEIEFWKKSGVRIVGYGYADDKTILPLQAADMIAYRSRHLQFQKLEEQIKSVEPVYVLPTVFDVMLARNLHPNTDFTPQITPELAAEIAQLSEEYSSVRRALLEVRGNYFKIKEKRGKSG